MPRIITDSLSYRVTFELKIVNFLGRKIFFLLTWPVTCGLDPPVFYCSRPPNSERDITDTQSRYANRKSYITLTCRCAFQIWRITDIDKKESFTNVEIISLPVLRYFMLRPLVFGIRSFLLVSVSLFRLNSSRRPCVSICLMFHMRDIGSLLMSISRPGVFLD